MRLPDPYRYPATPHHRKHGPAGYAHYREYKDWLRDEFDFRCVYCLHRERWGQVKGQFDLDHFDPQALRPDLALEYDNLVYACHSCNLDKSSRLVPDPHVHAYGACLRVEDNGEMTALNDQGTILIDELDLDAASRNEWRRTIIETVRMAVKTGEEELLLRWMALPENPPDLRKLRPPQGNSRTQGLAESWLERKTGCAVPDLFE